MKHTLSIGLLALISWMFVPCMNAETTFTCDTLQLGTDTMLVIETACAPICSSVVRVYDKDWKYIGILHSPYISAVFPEAYVENKRLCWRDNTYMMLDDEEKAVINKQKQ